jgi:hypothetical protein
LVPCPAAARAQYSALPTVAGEAQRCSDTTVDPESSTPGEFGKIIDGDLVLFRRIAREANIKAD